MPGARKPRQNRSALPEENDWLAEREGLDEPPAGGPTPNGSSRRSKPLKLVKTIDGDQLADDEPEPPAPTPPAPASSSSGISVPKPSLSLPTSVPSTGDVASLLTGLLLYTLFLNYLRYGPAGVTGWFRAKFMNDPIDPAALGSALDLGTAGSGGTGLDVGPIAPLGSPISTT